MRNCQHQASFLISILAVLTASLLSNGDLHRQAISNATIIEMFGIALPFKEIVALQTGN
jgi:hypothetical protein